jgi:hypothetical protein
MIMPLTYSIAYGLIAGIVSFAIMEGTFYLLELVGVPKPIFTDPFAPAAVTDDETNDTAAAKLAKEESEEESEGTTTEVVAQPMDKTKEDVDP